MTEKTTCKKCGSDLPANAPAGVCPRCLLQAGLLESSPEVSAATDATILTDSAAPSDQTNDPRTVRGRASSRNPPEAGEKVRYFGEYELLTEIARGGMGVVYRARQVRLNRIVALKMILAGQFAGPADVQRFHTEAEAAAQLDHPGIVPVYEVGEHDGHHFFTMGFVDGGSLASRLLVGPLAPREAALLVQQIAKAVQYAHEHGVIHRDLKPANILLDRTGQPRISDFGLAKNIHHDSGLTASGQVMGTPGYMPPEQASGNANLVKEPADVYSLGAILYALLTGRPPFQADNVMDTLMQVIEREPVAPSALNARVPQDLETICLKCLEKDRRRRYPSARELCAELQRFLEGRPILARPLGRIARSWRWCLRNPAVAFLSVAVILCLLAGTTVSAIFAVEARDRAKGEEMQRKEANRQTGIAREQLTRAQWLLYANAIASAQRESELNNPTKAIAHLDSTDPRLRSWEYYYLRRQNEQSMRSVIQAHARRVIALAISPDECTVASGGDDMTIKLWDSRTGQQLHMLDCGEHKVVQIAFCTSGIRLAGSCQDNKLRIWNTESGEVEQVIATSGVRAFVFTVDGESLISGHQDGTVRIWNVASGHEQQSWSLPAPTASISLAVSDDGSFLICGLPVSTSNSEIRRINLADTDAPGEEYRVVVANVPGIITDVTVDDEGTRIVSSAVSQQNSAQGAIQLWNAVTGKELVSLKFRAESVDFDATGRQLIGIGADRSMKVWEAQSGQEINSFEGQSGPYAPIACGRIRRLLLRGTRNGSVELWETGCLEPRMEIPVSDWGYSVGFSPDGNQLAVGISGALMICDAASGAPVRKMHGHDSGVRTVAFHPDGRQVLSAGGDAAIRLWDVASGQQLAQVGATPRDFDSVSFSPSGDRFATTSADGSGVQIFSGETAQPLIAMPGSGGTINTVAYGPDGVLLASGDEKGNLSLWDTKQQVIKWTSLLSGESIRSIAFSHDGKSIATGGRTVAVWDARTGQQKFAIRDPSWAASCVRFTPDSRRLVAGFADATIRFWSVESGQLVHTLNGNSGNIHSLAFSPDGRRLACTGHGGVVAVWDCGYLQN